MANRQQIDPRWVFDISEYVGKQLAITFEIQDKNGEVVPLTGYTGDAKIVDEEGTEILDLSPTINASNGYFIIDILIPADTPPGRYDWVGSLITSGGDEYPRFRGKVNLLTY